MACDASNRFSKIANDVNSPDRTLSIVVYRSGSLKPDDGGK
ncbi:hypothetical protein OP10G_3853 [Fimbriimonas ginsengisoli Gsoil 348]|uniref:Uncharacterized protein n=1 Tax=Fimbriimonas ginsengisoli Gsoil 348 TaxID=661478 RepID=A0A068NUU8_FIMGI|nr:hypothetical protein OP10G_3853 [Fimbriimonas ginsengisoli Gsoil 348]